MMIFLLWLSLPIQGDRPLRIVGRPRGAGYPPVSIAGGESKRPGAEGPRVHLAPGVASSAAVNAVHQEESQKRAATLTGSFQGNAQTFQSSVIPSALAY